MPTLTLQVSRKLDGCSEPFSVITKSSHFTHRLRLYHEQHTPQRCIQHDAAQDTANALRLLGSLGGTREMEPTDDIARRSSEADRIAHGPPADDLSMQNSSLTASACFCTALLGLTSNHERRTVTLPHPFPDLFRVSQCRSRHQADLASLSICGTKSYSSESMAQRQFAREELEVASVDQS